MNDMAAGLLEQLKDNLTDVPEVVRQLEREQFTRNLRKAIPYMWGVLEPSRDYIPGWSVDAICEHLEAVTTGQINRLIMGVPPGSMKSLTTRVFWPCYEWAQQPRMGEDGEIVPGTLKGRGAATRYIGASYAEHLAVRDNRRARSVITSPNYQRMFPHVKLSEEQKSKVNFANTDTGWMFATSTLGLGTGERGDRFIIDDPHNISDVESSKVRERAIQWFAEVVPSRLNSLSDSAIVVIMQRTHAEDVTGYALSRDLGYEHLLIPMRFDVKSYFDLVVQKKQTPADRREDLWAVLAGPDEDNIDVKTVMDFYYESFPSVINWRDPRTVDGELMWEERFPREDVDKLEKTLGPYATAAQMQQSPVSREGGSFEVDKIRIIENMPEGRYIWVRGWDLAGSDGTGAWTAGVKLGINTKTGRTLVANVVRDRKNPNGVRQMMSSTADMDGKKVEIVIPQDPGQAGKFQVGDIIAELAGYKVRAEPQTGSKETRAEPFAVQVGAGNVDVLNGPWTTKWVDELKFFPMGKFKDQVDATASAYNRAAVMKRRRIMPFDLPINTRSDKTGVS